MLETASDDITPLGIAKRIIKRFVENMPCNPDPDEWSFCVADNPNVIYSGAGIIHTPVLIIRMKYTLFVGEVQLVYNSKDKVNELDLNQTPPPKYKLREVGLTSAKRLIQQSLETGAYITSVRCPWCNSLDYLGAGRTKIGSLTQEIYCEDCAKKHGQHNSSLTTITEEHLDNLVEAKLWERREIRTADTNKLHSVIYCRAGGDVWEKLEEIYNE